MITVIHPSRGRPEMAYAAREQWARASGGEFEHIMSIDLDDEKMSSYVKTPVSSMHRIIINKNRSIVDAVNVAAKEAKGDILIVMSDDFVAPMNWINSIMELYKHINDNQDDKPFALLVNDALQKDLRTMTLPIMNRALYEKLGYIYWKEYFSVYCDNDISDVCRKLHCLYAVPDLIFEHRHYTNGKNKLDKTYQRENSSEAFSIGLKIYEQRTLRGFDL